MELAEDITQINFDRKTVLTVGTFDGIHRGHQALIERLVREANEIKGRSLLITFSPHPQTVIKRKNKKAIQILTTLEEKESILRKYGIDTTLVLNFTREFARLSPEEFIKSYLVEKIGISRMIFGYDHAFGKSRSGGIELLAEAGKEYGFDVIHAEPVYHDKMIISSTAIREVLHNGSVRIANEMLGFNYSITGKVVKGEGRGRKLNFPTANLELDYSYKLIPADGVYIGFVLWNNKKYQALVTIGHNPTFSGTKRQVEVYILNFNQSIYGEKIRIEFIKYMRGQIKFDNVDELIKKMYEDRNKAEIYFNKLEVDTCR